MYSSDQDFMDRLGRHLHSSPDHLVDKGDVLLNPDVREFYPSFREAAVLFCVIEREEGLSTLLNLRPKHLKNHGGQIGFPGGKVEQRDKNVVETAIREADEEIGLSADEIEPLGFLDAYITGSGFRVVPVVARVRPSKPLVLDKNEVEAAFEVPFSFLMNPQNHAHGFVQYKEKLRFYYEMPYREVHQTWRIWGVTAGIIRLLYETIYSDFPITMPHLHKQERVERS